MVKFYHSYDEGYGSYYITYRLYTGSSLIDIKERILKDLSYEFSSVGLGKEISEIDLSSSFDELDDDEGADKQIVFEFDGELARKIENVVEDGEPIGDYLRDLLSRHDLYIDWEFIDAIKKNLL